MNRVVEYIIRAKDYTRDAVKSAIRHVKEAGSEIDKTGGRARTLQSMLGLLRGGFDGLGQGMVSLLSRLKSLQQSFMKFTLVAGAVYAVVEAVKALRSWFSEVKKEIDDIQFENARSGIEAAKEASSQFAYEIDEARKNAAMLADQFNKELDAMQKLAKAQLEFNRAQELSIATTDEQRKAINERYNHMGAEDERQFAAQRRASERKELDAEIERLKEELKQAQEDELEGRASFQSAVRHQNKARAQVGNGAWGAIKGWFKGTVGADPAANLERWGGVRDSAARMMSDARKRQEEIRRKLEAAQGRRGTLDTEEQAAQIADAAARQNERNETAERIQKEAAKEQKAKDEAAMKEYKRRLKLEKDEERARIKAEKDEERRHKKRLSNLLKEAKESQSAADKRLDAAKDQAEKAWGWYRDPKAFRAQLKEEAADAKAEKRYEKDLESLQRRKGRNWRDAKNLSVRDEAVRRVAVAREEEEAAKKAALETAENTRRAAEALEALEGEMVESMKVG